MWINKSKIKLDSNEDGSESTLSSMKYCNGLYTGDEYGCISHYMNSDLLYKSQYFTKTFDYLESMEVLAKVTSFDVLRTGGVNEKIIACNERHIKLFDIRNNLSTKENVEHTRNECQVDEQNVCNTREQKFNCNGNEQFASSTNDEQFASKTSDEQSYSIAKEQQFNQQPNDVIYTHEMDKEFNNVHSYICNSISLNSDSTLFLSSDYLVVNLWRPDVLRGCYTLVDIKPPKHDQLVYVINTCKFSKQHNTVFGYSTTSGEVILNDTRLSTKSECILRHTNEERNKDGTPKSISDFCFTQDNKIMARKLNSVVLFDMRSPGTEIYRVVISEEVQNNKKLLETDAVYEKYKITENGKYAFTGTFGNTVYALNIEDGNKEEIVLDTKIQIDDYGDMTKFVEATPGGFFVEYGGFVYEYVE